MVENDRLILCIGTGLSWHCDGKKSAVFGKLDARPKSKKRKDKATQGSE
jgi:hypothetical protein